MSAAEADRWAWLLVLSFVFGCNVLRILLPSFSSFMSRVLQKDAEQESQMRAEIQGMKQELSTVNMMDEFARYARLERKINKMTDKLKTHVKARTAQLAKIKWVISVAFYVLQAALMVSLIWKYYSVPVAVVPSKWITPLDRLVAFPTRVAGSTPRMEPSAGLELMTLRWRPELRSRVRCLTSGATPVPLKLLPLKALGPTVEPRIRWHLKALASTDNKRRWPRFDLRSRGHERHRPRSVPATQVPGTPLVRTSHSSDEGKRFQRVRGLFLLLPTG
uniref:Guided entry of tail-anchored proteins factor 1 n=1 Tax=Felis catus TaxID=9685 RepID=A0ABI8A7H8_FELCA